MRRRSLITRLFLVSLFASAVAGCAGSGLQLYRASLLAPGPAKGGCRLWATWLGGAGFALDDGETRLLIDPFVSRYGMWHVIMRRRCPPRLDLVRRWTRKLGLGRVAAVLVTHSHYDHVLDAPYFARSTGALLVGSESTANVGRGAGLGPDRLRVVQAGERLSFGKFRVRFLESEHARLAFGRVPYRGRILRPLISPAPAAAYRVGAVYALLVEHPCGRILHLGSAGNRPGRLRGVRADTVLLSIPGRASTSDLLTKVVNTVGARRLIPIHFDDLFSPLDEPMGLLPFIDFPEFMRTTRRLRPDLELGTLPIGVPVRLDRSTRPTTRIR